MILELIAEATSLAKDGRASNTELSLYRWYPDRTWRCEIGNPSESVCIGEVDGEFRGEGNTLEEALRDLVVNLRENRRYL